MVGWQGGSFQGSAMVRLAATVVVNCTGETRSVNAIVIVQVGGPVGQCKARQGKLFVIYLRSCEKDQPGIENKKKGIKKLTC